MRIWKEEEECRVKEGGGGGESEECKGEMEEET